MTRFGIWLFGLLLSSQALGYAEGVGSNEDEGAPTAAEVRAKRESYRQQGGEIVRPRQVPNPEPPTPLDPAILRNYDYVTEHQKDWRAAEAEFAQAAQEWMQGRKCSIEFFKIADRCSPRFQNGIPRDIYEKMQNCGWRSLYYELKPLPSEGFTPYCNNPECKHCQANDPEHITKILRRVEYRRRGWMIEDKLRHQLQELKPEPEIVPARRPKLEPVPDPENKPQEDVRPRKKRGKNTALA